jgi:hypothetical protein
LPTLRRMAGEIHQPPPRPIQRLGSLLCLVLRRTVPSFILIAPKLLCMSRLCWPR